MSNTKAKIFIKVLVSLIKELLKLTALAIYLLSKMIEIVTSFICRILEKILKLND